MERGIRSTTPDVRVGDEVHICGGGSAGRNAEVLSLHRRKHLVRLRLLGDCPRKIQVWEGYIEPLSAVDQLGRLGAC